jgi:hypothetical protein
MESGSINDRDAPYHKAMIDGEMPEILDPQAMPEGLGRRACGNHRSPGTDRMTKLVALYEKLKDAEAFDRHYSSAHMRSRRRFQA